jgi:predicted glycogen debranching enzyme
MIAFGREVCGNLDIASEREFLLTNGIGGYAAGTIAGLLTRSYHGLLVAALKPPLGRTLLLAKVDEIADYDDQSFPLFCNHWASGVVEPDGFNYLESFCLEGTTPVWAFALGDALLEKRIWMQPGENTTYLQYRYVRPRRNSSSGQDSRRIDLTLRPLVNFRDHHSVTRASSQPMLQIEALQDGLRMTPASGSAPFFLRFNPDHKPVTVTARNEWFLDFFLREEADRGLEAVDDHLVAGAIRVCLEPGDCFCLVASAELDPNLDGESAYEERTRHESSLLAAARGSLLQSSPAEVDLQPAIEQLALAADQFIVRRASALEPQGKTIVAGYPWFGDWGRDTMISLPGLTLATGRPEIARSILHTFAAYEDRGMLPNRFPDEGETPEYNTVDATLWYFEAIRAYFAATGDKELLLELFPVLCDIIDWHMRGTRYQIHCDPQDGLLYAGEPGVQLTWMDAKVDDWVVTPRIGKPVEVNALWYNALCSMADFSRQLGQPDQSFLILARQTLLGFARFWNEAQDCCFDVLDGPHGNDSSLRPNQIFSVALANSPLPPTRQRLVVDACSRFLLTSHGLRSLAAHEPGYIGSYRGDRHLRDSAYHQGTVWAWLIGPFVSAHLRVYADPQAACSFLTPLFRHLQDHGLGSISEIFDGDPPFSPHGCIAQAWSVAEVLRSWVEIQKFSKEQNG